MPIRHSLLRGGTIVLVALSFSGCASVDIVIDTSDPRPGDSDYARVIFDQKREAREQSASAPTVGGNASR